MSPSPLSICVLGSSSGGNSTLIWSPETAILIDCGFNPLYMVNALRFRGIELQDLDGVFITHVHGDHVNEFTVGRLVDKDIPIFCPPHIEAHLKHRLRSFARASRQNLLKPMKQMETQVGDFVVQPFEVPHDSDGGCFGYTVASGIDGSTKKISVTTDIAHPTPSASRSMADSDVIVIESNYDPEMLENSARPGWLKKRIRENGHLSNEQCAESVLDTIERSKKLPSTVALAHVSQECNTNQLALKCTRLALEARGITSISLAETHPDRPGKTIVV